MSAASKDYRVRIANRGATTVEGNVALTLSLDELAGVPTVTGPSLKLLDATSTSIPFQVPCIVDDPLFVSAGRLAVIGRLVEIQHNPDAAGWATIATGRVTGVTETEGRGKLVLQVSDEGWAERNGEVFGTTDTVQLHPPGLASAFMDFEAAGSETYVVLAVSGNAVNIAATRIGTPTGSLKVPRSLRLALVEDLLPSQDLDLSPTNSAGNFTALRFDLDSGGPTPGDRTVLGFDSNLSGLVTTRSVLGNMRPAGDGTVRTAWIYFGSGHGLVADDEIVGRFYFPSGIPVRENVPVHIGGADGIHPMTLLKELLDGDHGGQAVQYPSAVMATLEALPLPPVWLRKDSTEKRAAWAAPSLYQPFGVAPLIGTDLQARPTQITFPQDVSIGGLDTIGAGDGNEVTWEHGIQDLVTEIRFSFQSIDEVPGTDDPGADWPVDDLASVVESIRPIEHDNVATLGRVTREYKTDLCFGRGGDFSARSAAADVTQMLATAIFNLFGDGPARGRLRVADNAGHQAGELKILDLDTIKIFNPEVSARSGQRLVRLVGFDSMALASTVFRFLDMGPASAALAAPSVTITQDVTNPDLVNVTVASLPSGATAVVQCHAAASTPTDYEFVRAPVGNETVQFRVGAGSGNAYARAKSVAPGRLESAWATDSVALTARARIATASVVRTTLTDFEVRWTVPAGTPAMKTDYSVHSRLEAPTFGSNVVDYDAADGGFRVEGAMSSTRQMVTVRLTPYPTLSAGPTASGTPGDVLEVSAAFVQTKGGSGIVRTEVPYMEITFDENGNVVCSAQADSEAAAIYLTVGDGTSPSDPTPSTNDASISGRSGTVVTSEKITTGRDAYVKAVAADASGNLGPVTEVRQGRRIGPFHKDTTSRPTAGTGVDTLETITVPANSLGPDGVIRLTLSFELNGINDTKTIRLSFGGSSFLTSGFAAANNQGVRLEVLLFNDGSTSAQQMEVLQLNGDTSGSNQVILSTATTAVDTTADQDMVVTGECDNAADEVDLVFSMAEHVGTN